MAFVRFENDGITTPSKASLYANGMISFTIGAKKRLHMDNFSHIIMFYDTESQKIALQLSNGEEECGLKLRMRQNGADINAKAFFEFFKIQIKETRSYEIYTDNEGRIIIDTKNFKSSKPKAPYKSRTPQVEQPTHENSEQEANAVA